MEKGFDYDRPSIFKRLNDKLDQKRIEGSYRSLVPISSVIQDDVSQGQPTKSNEVIIKKSASDFASNDYLGLARCPKQLSLVQTSFDTYTRSLTDKTSRHGESTWSHHQGILGSTGSRLLSGDSHLARNLEHHLAEVHKRPSALLCNSGYDANLSLLSSLPLEGDFIIADNLIHNSLIMGIRMGRLQKDDFYTFIHNNTVDLRRILVDLSGKRLEATRAIAGSYHPEIFIVIESVYSMDGDIAPMKDILDLALEFRAHVIVDEAHGFGVYGLSNAHDMVERLENPSDFAIPQSNCGDFHENGGLGVLAALGLESHKALLATVYTFGKAAGCHGAVIVSSDLVIQYLVNYARPFIYSTSLPCHSILSISCSYTTIMGKEGDLRRCHLFKLVRYFRLSFMSAVRRILPEEDISSILIPSPSPIQAVLCRGNETCLLWARQLQQYGLNVFAIRFPTVAKGSERIRIIIHYHNTEDQISELVNHLIHLMSHRQHNQVWSRL
jgi:8-amino-7-oxononanoate synthase